MKLLSIYLSEFNYREIHRIKINASSEKIFKAVKELKVEEISSIMSILIKLRGLGSKKKNSQIKNDNPLLDNMADEGFYILEEGKEEMVFGLIGEFWKLSPEPVIVKSREEYLSHLNSKYAVAATNMLIYEAKGSKILSTETRIFISDKTNRKKFGLYWKIIRLGSGIIRRVWLKAIKKKAENYN